MSRNTRRSSGIYYDRDQYDGTIFSPSSIDPALADAITACTVCAQDARREAYLAHVDCAGQPAPLFRSASERSSVLGVFIASRSHRQLCLQIDGRCSGDESLKELCGHLNLDVAMFECAICIPCRMPYITSMFMPRAPGDHPLPIPVNTKNFAFVEIPVDVVFTVEYSVGVAQTIVYKFLNIDREVAPITANDKSIMVRVNSVIKAFA